MCKSELYRQILGTVSQETEISEERILSKAKNAEIVDARYLLVYFLWRQGFHAPAKVCRSRRIGVIPGTIPELFRA